MLKSPISVLPLLWITAWFSLILLWEKIGLKHECAIYCFKLSSSNCGVWKPTTCWLLLLAPGIGQETKRTSFFSGNLRSHGRLTIKPKCSKSVNYMMCFRRCPRKWKGQVGSREQKCEESSRRGRLVFTILNKVVRGKRTSRKLN